MTLDQGRVAPLHVRVGSWSARVTTDDPDLAEYLGDAFADVRVPHVDVPHADVVATGFAAPTEIDIVRHEFPWESWVLHVDGVARGHEYVQSSIADAVVRMVVGLSAQGVAAFHGSAFVHDGSVVLVVSAVNRRAGYSAVHAAQRGATALCTNVVMIGGDLAVLPARLPVVVTGTDLPALYAEAQPHLVGYQLLELFAAPSALGAVAVHGTTGSLVPALIAVIGLDPSEDGPIALRPVETFAQLWHARVEPDRDHDDPPNDRRDDAPSVARGVFDAAAALARATPAIMVAPGPTDELLDQIVRSLADRGGAAAAVGAGS